MPTQNLIEFILYITPGFIAIAIFREKYPAKERASFVEISSCVIYGLLIISILNWMDKNIFNFYFESNLSGFPSFRYTIAILSSGIIGGLVAIGITEFLNFLSEKLHIKFLHKDTDTIWQFINSNDQKDWVIVFLSDNTIYLGWISKYCYDPNNQSQEFLLSHAKSVTSELKTKYEVDGLGVYLNTKDVKRIELVKGNKFEQ